MKSVVQISDLPDVMSVDELMDVKGGIAGNGALCGFFSSAVSCNVYGSGFCSVVGSGICTAVGSGIKTPDPVDPNPDPIPADPEPTPGT